MLKVRLMGTKEDIVKFWKFLQNAPTRKLNLKIW